MKSKRMILLATVFSLIVCIFLSTKANVANEVNATVVSNDLVVEKHATFADGGKYSGAKVAPHLNVGEFATFTVVDDGGDHVDGDGNRVFSNYVVFGVTLNYDKNTKLIGKTGVKVSWDTCDWNETPHADKGDTEQYIAYGAISATKTDAYGNVFKYEPMFSKGNTSVENMIFNEDGDYTVFVLFETNKNGIYQNHVLSWSFKIRSYVYLVDKATGFPIKESGISNKPVVLDCASRGNVDIECVYTDISGKSYSLGMADGEEIYKNGTYSFTVLSNGFVCEKFDFCIDTINPISKFFFGNLRKQLSDFYYEAEEYFYLTWTESSINPISVTYQFYDYHIDYGNENTPMPPEVSYTNGTKLSEVGLYYVKCKTLTEEKIEYWIEVVSGDSPSYNYEVLSKERFNNFKTKWYEVYDDINGRYLCFDVEEYDIAYEAAMTIENSSVIANNGKYYYNNNWYDDRIDLTSAMNEYVFTHNLKTVYYDPTAFFNDEESERRFTLAAFDGTRYLNDDFQFVNSHYSETYTVIATDKDGVPYDLQYFKPISEQGLSDGEYIITETDKYGNSTSYTVYRDKSAPIIELAFDGDTIIAKDGGFYVAKNGFSITDFKDAFDDYAVLKIEKQNLSTVYYYKDEYCGIIFEQKGDYTISAYDRNGNVIKFSIEVY